MSQTDSLQTTGASKTKKTLYIALGVGIVIIIALLATVIYLLAKSKDELNEQSTTGGRATIVTPENVEAVMAQQEEPVQAGYYSCKMNVDWNFIDSSSPSYNAYVANSEINAYTVYFDVFLEESGEIVYSSPYMPVGSELTDITLDADLNGGDYPAIVTYHLVDDDMQELSTVSVTVTLHIEN